MKCFLRKFSPKILLCRYLTVLRLAVKYIISPFEYNAPIKTPFWRAVSLDYRVSSCRFSRARAACFDYSLRQMVMESWNPDFWASSNWIPLVSSKKFFACYLFCCPECYCCDCHGGIYPNSFR